MTARRSQSRNHPTKKRPPQNARAVRRCGWHIRTRARIAVCVRERKSAVVEVAGEMREIGARQKRRNTRRSTSGILRAALGYALARGNNPGSAYYRYKAKFGVGPSMAKPEPKRLALR